MQLQAGACLNLQTAWNKSPERCTQCWSAKFSTQSFMKIS